MTTGAQPDPIQFFAGQQDYWRGQPFDAQAPQAWQRGWVIAAREGALTLIESRTLIEARTPLANAVAKALALVRRAITGEPAVRAEAIADLEGALRLLNTFDPGIAGGRLPAGEQPATTRTAASRAAGSPAGSRPRQLRKAREGRA